MTVMTSLAGASPEQLEAVYEDLLKQLPSRAPIYLPTEKIAMADRIRGIEHVIRIYKSDLKDIYQPRLRALRDQYRGSKRCFLIGNGPSLNQTDLSMLKNEVTFAVNGFFLKAQELDWLPTFYCVEDHLVAEDRAPWINDFHGPVKFFPAYLGYMFGADADTVFYNHRPRKSYPHGFDFSMEADRITYTGCTVTFSLMQLAAYLGFEEIYLVGVDASYDIPKDAEESKDYGTGVLDMKSDDPNHFDPNYFGKGFRWHDPQVEKMVEAYAEAKKTLTGTGQTIYNATIGGKLEVFERVAFDRLFPKARSPEVVLRDGQRPLVATRDPAAFPKMLVLDMTPAGNGSATGEIKANLLANWPADRILQVAHRGPAGLQLAELDAGGDWTATVTTAEAAGAAVDAFAPDLVMYRPVPDTPALHPFAMETIARLDKPLVTWVMDDWPARLAIEKPADFAVLGPDLDHLLARSARRLSICQAMSDAFADRYGQDFVPLANGIDPTDWPPLRPHGPGPLLVRYAGGLAENMTRDAVLRIARSVETLARSGVPMRLEIHTQPWWYAQSKALFDGFAHTVIDTTTRPAAAYRSWLAEADVLLIAYNFDPATLRYVQYSMANKTPECLASGAAVLAHGPAGIATLDYLAATDTAMVVGENSDGAVIAALRRLATDPALRAEMAARARRTAFAAHDLRRLRETLLELLQKAAVPGAAAAETLALRRELAELKAHYAALDARAQALERTTAAGGMPVRMAAGTAGAEARERAERLQRDMAERQEIIARIRDLLRPPAPALPDADDRPPG
jgi:glycosyltransferase involved in cell wall biosynthesis